ncbi:alpha/beta hydrolase [Demetria terragena]|uniref:alpha/beta hydrolase n=1 Tax=Demetria terragena TaxID=63959 RepID=UPI00039E7AE7|nr:alpha/beta hydrolase family protein [Demetria terragena]
MIHMRCDFFSDALELSTSMTVLMPQSTSTQIGMGGTSREGQAPVLYLLHGLSDDDTAWMRRTSIERYASELGIAVVMPQVHRSFYTDLAHGGGRYWAFVAGLSMGGYGALKLALRQPGRFAAAGSLSGALDICAVHESGSREDLVANIWGAGGPPAEDDLVELLRAADPAALPALWATCGTDDELISHQRTVVEAAERRGIAITAEEHPGEHTWEFWDEHIQRFLAWLPLDREV